ncbi:MAG TPA: phosphomannose isomerase type II C-terminal cupin domain [Candidatus Paceibacterota bacterium]
MAEFKPFQEERPWGNFRQFSHNKLSTIKIILVKNGGAFSLQYHNNRTEFWRILSGSPEITIGESVIHAQQGDEFEIPPKTKHCVRSTLANTEILEISVGEFDEEDIVRLADDYGRA